MAPLITIEGIEGAGKSSVAQLICAALEHRGVAYLHTREPGGTPIGEAIRAIMLNPEHHHLSPLTELLLVFASRAQHLAELIRPALNEGRWVLCERFTDATYAYQVAGRGLPESVLNTLAHWVQEGLQPDLTLWLDVPVAIGLERAGRRGALDRIEQESLVFFERVRDAYASLAQRHPQRIHRIDATIPLEQMASQVQHLLDELEHHASC